MSNTKWETLASDESIERVKKALEGNGIKVRVVENKEEAKEKVLEMIPAGAEVMVMSSVTLETVGLAGKIDKSGKFNSVRGKLMTMDRKTQTGEMQKLAAAPEWTVGSVHAVTEDGKVIIASNTGSQLPAYAYGSSHVVWVAGTQKIVANLEEGLKRIYEYILPLESERARKAYGVAGSAVNKLLIINQEAAPERMTIVFVKEKLGY